MSFKIKSQAEQTRERIEKNFSQGLELQKGKALPIGTINKWGEQKMADGSWKYVGKQAATATKAKEEKQNTSSLLTSSEGEVSIEGEKHTYRVYKDGGVKVEGFNMRKDFKSKAEAEKYLSGVGAKKYKHPSVGKMMELKGDVNLVSTMDLKGKTLEIVDTRDVQFASGAKTYYIYEEGGKRKEISEDLVTVKGEGKNAPVKKKEGPYTPKQRQSKEAPSRYPSRTSPILPLGYINLKTGSSKYFNVYETWGEDSTYEIWETENHSPNPNRGKKTYRIVVTSGKKPLNDVGDRGMFKHDQTGASLFVGKMVDWATGTDLKKLAPVYGNSITGATYK